MKHAVLISAYNNIEHLKSLVLQFDDDFDIFIHLDKKSKFKKEDIEHLKSINNVRSVVSTYKVNWGGYKLLKAFIHLMRIANNIGGYSYYHTLSGQDIVVKSSQEIKDFFNANNGSEFIEFFSLPSEKWEGGGKERFFRFHFYDTFNCKTPLGFKVNKIILKFQRILGLTRPPFGGFEIFYGGSCWFSISEKCVSYCLRRIENNPGLIKGIAYTLLPEEMFFQTLIVNAEFKDKVINNNLRYIDWTFKNGNSPAVLDEFDYENIKNSGQLFAKKVDGSVSKSLVKLIEMGR